MKTLFLFDIDGTLYDNKNNKIHDSTLKAIKKIRQNEKYALGIATGRSKQQLLTIKPILKYFDFLITLNGAVVYYKDEKLINNPIKTSVVTEVLKFSEELGIGLAYIGEEEFKITKLDNSIIASSRNYNLEIPDIDIDFYKRTDIYQIWAFSENKDLYLTYRKRFNHLTVYPWSKHGFDLVNLDVNKGDMALLLKEKFNFDQLVTFGDGSNDFELITKADIGIAMGNSRFETLKKAATNVSLPIDQDGLYKILKSLNFI